MKLLIQSYLKLFLLVLVYSCNNNSQKSSSESKTNLRDTETEVLAIAREHINSQYDYLTGKTKSPKWQEYQIAKDINDTLKKLIDIYKSELSKIEFAYNDYNSELNIDTLLVKDSILTLLVKEKYSLTTNDKDPSDTSKYIITEGLSYYKFIFVKENDSYLIQNFEPFDTNRFKINIKYSGQKDGRISPIEKKSLLYSFDRNHARDYAYLHYLNGNPEYCDYTLGGGDCTNFLSQCLMTGGWTKSNDWTSKLKTDCKNPHCANTTCVAKECYSCSWTVAQDFKYYITHSGSGRKESGSFPDEQLEIGDLLQLAANSSSNVGHSCLVTKKTNSNGIIKVYVTCRTSSGYLPVKDKLSIEFTSFHYGWKLKNSAS